MFEIGGTVKNVVLTLIPLARTTKILVVAIRISFDRTDGKGTGRRHCQ